MNKIKSKLKQLRFRYSGVISSAVINTPPGKDRGNNKHGQLLVQITENDYYFFLFRVISEMLDEKHGIASQSYLSRSLRPAAFHSPLSFIKSIVYQNGITDRKYIQRYGYFIGAVISSFKALELPHVVIRRLYQSFGLFQQIHDKDSLLSLQVDGVHVGDLIYDSYLRYKPAATVNTRHIYLWLVIYQCLKNIEISQATISNSNINALLTSYTTYIDHGVMARVAIARGLDVYSFGSFKHFVGEHDSSKLSHITPHIQYKATFEQLTDAQKAIALEQSEKALLKRMGGSIDKATYYMKESPYKKSDLAVPDLTDYLVIFLHDFFDSPHIYDWMLFADFYEWINYTLDYARQQNIPVAIKPHPNQISDSAKIVTSLKQKFPDTLFLSPKLTNKQLVDAGMACGLTVYGTVVHELNFMGKPCITCGDHPSISFDDSLTARTLERYRELLNNYHKADFDQNVARQNSLAFYYCSNLLLSESESALQDILIAYKTRLSQGMNFDIETQYAEFKQQVTSIMAFEDGLETIANNSFGES